MRFLVEKLAAETSASTRESSGGSAMVITPRVTVSLPRTLPSPNMCLVTNETDDPAGSEAYRPAGGAFSAVLVVHLSEAPLDEDPCGWGGPGTAAAGVGQPRSIDVHA